MEWYGLRVLKPVARFLIRIVDIRSLLSMQY